MIPLATSAKDCDIKRPPPINIIAPASNVPQEFAQFSGKWTGFWASKHCTVLVIETIDAEGNVEGVYDVAGATPARKFQSQIIDGKITIGPHTYMLSGAEIDGRITGGTETDVTMEKVENP
jgi:hypothetical protein